MKRTLTIACLALLVQVLLPLDLSIASASNVQVTKADVERIIKRVEERSDDFRKVIDSSLDRSALDGTNREDNINQQVKELENAIDKLRSEFDRADTWAETRAQVQRVMNEADEVNAIVRRGRWRRGGPVRASWAHVRADLNRLAGVYNLRLLNA